MGKCADGHRSFSIERSQLLFIRGVVIIVLQIICIDNARPVFIRKRLVQLVICAFPFVYFALACKIENNTMVAIVTRLAILQPFGVKAYFYLVAAFSRQIGKGLIPLVLRALDLRQNEWLKN